jgi:OOP family OmpA-OmpF porin
MFVKSYKILLATSILLSGIGAYANSATETEQSSLKYSNWYIGTSFGEGDYSKFTIGDAELDSLTTVIHEQKPNIFSITAGKKINENLALEFSYIDLGETEYRGTLGSAALNSTSEATAVTAMFVLKPFNEKLSPFIKFGYGHQFAKTRSIKENAVGVFSNPYNESTSSSGGGFIYGLGVDYNLSDHFFLRAQTEILTNHQTDYINNIDNGYIERDSSLNQVGLFYRFDGNNNSHYASNWDVSIFYGSSKTGASMSGGSYSGNVYNLTTNTVAAQVSGLMTDDKSEEYKRFSLIRNYADNYYSEVFYADFGTSKNRSSNLGITGSGNALTGSATKTAHAYGASLAKNLSLLPSISVSPSIGLAYVKHIDQIYNNLDFSGVGGSSRGPINKYNDITYTVGIKIDYELMKDLSIGLRYDYFGKTGSDDALGKGTLAGYGFGMTLKF